MPKKDPVISFSKEPQGELAPALDSLRDVLMRHPIACQAAYAALVAEGRRYAETEEGERWKQRLSGSELVANLRVIWESLSMTAFAENEEQPLPSFFLDSVVRAATEEGLESLLSRVFDSRL
jgi:hypothetical protein